MPWSSKCQKNCYKWNQINMTLLVVKTVQYLKHIFQLYLLVWWNVQVWQLWPKSLDGWTVGRFFIFLLSRMWWEMQNKRYFFTTCTLPSPKCELIFWYIRRTLAVLWECFGSAFLLSRMWWEMQNKRFFFTLRGLW